MIVIPELWTISPVNPSSIIENSQSKLRKTWLSFLSVFVILTHRGLQSPNNFYKTVNELNILDSNISKINIFSQNNTNYFLPRFTTIVEIFETESGLHELNILQPQIQSNVSSSFVNEGKHFYEEWKLIRIKGVVLIPRTDHALVNFLLSLWIISIWKLKLIILSDPTIFAVSHCSIQILDNTGLIGLAQLLIWG